MGWGKGGGGRGGMGARARARRAGGSASASAAAAAAAAVACGAGLLLLPGARAAGARALLQGAPSPTVAANLASAGLGWSDVPAEIQNLPPAALEDWAALVAESFSGAPSGGMSFGGAPGPQGSQGSGEAGTSGGGLDLSAFQAFMPEGVDLTALQNFIPQDWTAMSPVFGVQTPGGWQNWAALFPGAATSAPSLAGVDWSQFMPPGAADAGQAFSDLLAVMENFANQSASQATAGMTEFGSLLDESLDFILNAQSSADEVSAGLLAELLPGSNNSSADSEAKSNAPTSPVNLADAFAKMAQAPDVGSYLNTWEGLTKMLHSKGEDVIGIGLSATQQQMIFNSVEAFRKQFPAVLLNPNVANYLLWARGPDWKVHSRLIKMWKISSWISGYAQGLKIGSSPVGIASSFASKALAKTAMPHFPTFPGGFR